MSICLRTRGGRKKEGKRNKEEGSGKDGHMPQDQRWEGRK
jgi:hypothetical protein